MSYSWGAERRPGGAEPRRPTDVERLGPEADPMQVRRLAGELAPMVAVWQRLIDQHTPDRSGCCRKCSTGGSGRSGTAWPCNVYSIAELARRRHHRDTA